MKFDIFISYRRNSGNHQADALQANLKLKGYSVFKDTHTMGGGDFTKNLENKIRESCNFVVVISKNCFPHEGTDYFLYEIGQALKQGKNVIPVYYDDMGYNDIEKYISWIEDFDKQNAINYHNDDPEGSVGQIIKYLKTENEVLKERFETLSMERITVRQELMLLEGDRLDFKCPVCNNSNNAALTYCNTCGYKFFDELDECVASNNEKMLELGRIKKHRELWLTRQSGEHQNDSEQKKELELTRNKLQITENERNELRKKLNEEKTISEAIRQELEVLSYEFQKRLEDITNKDLELSALRNNVYSLQKDFEQKEKRNDELEKGYKAFKERQKEVEKKIREEERSIQRKLMCEMEEQKAERDRAENEMHVLREEISVMQIELDKEKKEKEEIEKRNDELKKMYDESEYRQKEIRDEERKRQRELMNEMEVQKAERDRVEKEMHVLRKGISVMQIELDNEKKEKEEIKKRNDELEKKYYALKDRQKYVEKQIREEERKRTDAKMDALRKSIESSQTVIEEKDEIANEKAEKNWLKALFPNF